MLSIWRFIRTLNKLRLYREGSSKTEDSIRLVILSCFLTFGCLPGIALRWFSKDGLKGVQTFNSLSDSILISRIRWRIGRNAQCGQNWVLPDKCGGFLCNEGIRFLWSRNSFRTWFCEYFCVWKVSAYRMALRVIVRRARTLIRLDCAPEIRRAGAGDIRWCYIYDMHDERGFAGFVMYAVSKCQT